MKISIITTSFNHCAFIAETLESVHAQNFPEIEHLILDGGSTDGTVEWLRDTIRGSQWGHVHWQSEADSGQSEAMNKGFRLATGDIIGWLNSDDRYCAQTLTRVAQVFALHPEIDVLYGDYTLMDEAGRVLTQRREIAFNRFTVLHHKVPFIPTTATFFRRRIFDEENWLDESLHYAMDYEFYVRLAAKGYRFKHVPGILADFRLHSNSKTCTQAAKQIMEMRAVTERYSKISRIRSRRVRTVAFAFLRRVAALLRYSEKLMRGYYWSQRNPKSLGA